MMVKLKKKEERCSVNEESYTVFSGHYVFTLIISVSFCKLKNEHVSIDSDRRPEYVEQKQFFYDV